MKMKGEHILSANCQGVQSSMHLHKYPCFSWLILVPGSENHIIVTTFCINLMYYYLESHKHAQKIAGTTSKFTQ